MKLGIVHERINPAGRSRMGDMSGCIELSRKTQTKPPALTLVGSRRSSPGLGKLSITSPHEGLNNATPGSIYQPSSMTLPRNLIEYVYPKGFELRRVNNSGDIGWHKGRVFISDVLRFEILGFDRSRETFTTSIFGMLRSVSLT